MCFGKGAAKRQARTFEQIDTGGRAKLLHPWADGALELGRGGALHWCSETSAVEPGEGQMGNVGFHLHS